MGGPAPSSAKAQLRQGWLDQQKRLVDYTRADWKAMKLEDHWMWYQPKGWSGDLFDLVGMHEPFKRDDMEQDFESVMKSGDGPGCAGDLMLIQLQGDWLASLERAFRERHKTWPRMMVQANCRRYGHQHEKGLLEVGMKDYLTFISRHSSADAVG